MVSKAPTEETILPVQLHKLTANGNYIQLIYSGPDQQQYQLEFAVRTKQNQRVS